MPDKPFYLAIPEPCHEKWEEMTPCAQGRFCAQCSKTVIDFTSWSDKALFEFFSKKSNAVCGRFSSTQLHRKIDLPPQPNSRLYKIAIACGLALMFTQVPEAHANVRTPIEILSEMNDNNGSDTLKNDTDTSYSLHGTATDENGDPVIGAMIEVYQKDKKQAGAVTNIDGNYIIKNLPTGKYTILVRYTSYKAARINDIVVTEGKATRIDVDLEPAIYGGLIIMYTPPLIDQRGNVNSKFSGDDIRNAGR